MPPKENTEEYYDPDWEAGKEQLAQLIKEAGDEARAQSAKFMEIHRRRLREAAAEGIAWRKKREEHWRSKNRS